MDEPARTSPPPALNAKRQLAADKIERQLKWQLPMSLLLGSIVIAVGASDFISRWLNVSRRLDAVLIIGGLSALYSPIRMRRTARRLRAIETQPATKTRAAKAVGSLLASFAMIFIVGYLLGGWLIAVLLTGPVLVLTAALMLRAWMQIRRRRQAG
jgi:hypothetical protein